MRRRGRCAPGSRSTTWTCCRWGASRRSSAAEPLDELARTVRKQLAGKIPEVQIPVKIEQAIDLPSVTQGPVRIQGASMPLAVSVADVVRRPGRAVDRPQRGPGRAGQDQGRGGPREPARDSCRRRSPACSRSSSIFGCGRNDAATPEQMQAQDRGPGARARRARVRSNQMVTKDPRLAGMPENGVRVGVPTPLVRTLVQRVVGGFVDSVTLKLDQPQGAQGRQDQEGRSDRRVRPQRRDRGGDGQARRPASPRSASGATRSRSPCRSGW